MYLPEIIKRIDVTVFSGCTSLTDIYYAGTHSQWDADIMGDGETKMESVSGSGTDLNIVMKTWNWDDELYGVSIHYNSW